MNNLLFYCFILCRPRASARIGVYVHHYLRSVFKGSGMAIQNMYFYTFGIDEPFLFTCEIFFSRQCMIVE
jgi:hypothetical protein